jgi:hypothetical protein
MSTRTLVRWGGLAALVSGVAGIALEIAMVVVFGDQPMSIAGLTPQWLVLLATMLVEMILAMLGLVALYARQSQNAGGLGVVAFVAAVIGTIMLSAWMWAGTFDVPAFAEAAPEFMDTFEASPSGTIFAGAILSFLSFGIGWFLFGLASLRAAILPRVSSWLVMVGAVLGVVLAVVDLPLGGAVFDLGLAWMGWWLWSEPAPTA